MTPSTQAPRLGELLQDYFYGHLINQRQLSARTVATYRDVFRLLLRFAVVHRHRALGQMTLSDLDAELVLAFLEHLQVDRCNGARTRNARLAAIRSFLHYAVLKDPLALATVENVLAIPAKRYDRAAIHYLSVDEITAVLEAPDAATWSGRRDQALLQILYNTGARVSEVIGLRRADVDLHGRRVVHIHGKGRKERVIPLWASTATRLRQWLAQSPKAPETPVFPSRFGAAMSRTGVEQRLAAAVSKAATGCPSLAHARVTPHVVRHTTAMHMLQSGVDLSVIALWLGHESIETTHRYVEADLAMKEDALGKLQAPNTATTRYQPPQEILAFLDAL